MKKRTLGNCMKRAQRRIGKRLRTALAHAESKLPEKLVRKLEKVYEEISEYFVFRPIIPLFTNSRLAWNVSSVLVNLRRTISRQRQALTKRIRRELEYPQGCLELKASGSMHRLRYYIHTALKGKRCEKHISEHGLPESFHYEVEGFIARDGAVIMIDSCCYDVRKDPHVHIVSENGVEFVFNVDSNKRIAGDRYAIPDDDYVDILLWIWRHERELSFEWYAYASPIVQWHRWNVIDRYRTFTRRIAVALVEVSQKMTRRRCSPAAGHSFCAEEIVRSGAVAERDGPLRAAARCDHTERDTYP